MARFYIFFIDKSMFSPRICRYSMGKLMVEVLNTMKSVKFIKIKGPREAWPLGVETKTFPRGQDLTIFENLPGGGGDGNAWN